MKEENEKWMNKYLDMICKSYAMNEAAAAFIRQYIERILEGELDISMTITAGRTEILIDRTYNRARREYEIMHMPNGNNAE